MNLMISAAYPYGRFSGRSGDGAVQIVLFHGNAFRGGK
ncbi:hypothetical protein V22_08070 [Calycomorphotria hydatis]|uniref:Uncharacterized protein n=1 Tax=Calycomorphotria hydatis TaxID=2528027 RepID=A0A517T5D0_9PLAN|nr:hypothetical protein V22_08070 [Calycomorphotria hydatis]